MQDNRPSSQPFTESIVALGIAATYTGPARDGGGAIGFNSPWAYFNAFANTDQAGTLFIECSPTGAVWTVVASAAIVAATPLILQVPVMTRFHRVRLLNGGVAQTILATNSSYTAA